jgi:3-oxoacyl-[acyl-carrier-protein] synthase III
MPEDEFYGFMKICDTFDLMILEKTFASSVYEKLKNHSLNLSSHLDKLLFEVEIEEIERFISEQSAEPLYYEGKLVGCVKRAHELDPTLSAHVMAENIAYKASAVLTLMWLFKNNGINPEEINYIIEASEEACGDMYQRGGGNFAKSIGEVVGCINTTGSDTRGFCAGPAHALVNAAALVQSGIYKNVVVVAGGTTAKLGMNGKDHVAKAIPILEDVLGGFAILVSQNDGENPILRTDLIGRHTIGTGSSPQAVMQSIVVNSLDKAGLKICDVDKYSVEMQNPEITEPAGAGNVPLANYKMIAALAVKRGEISREEMMKFVNKHGMLGFAPTQGHIPSGVPFIGPARNQILDGKITRAMIIGKGSLFLGRMTNLFDGISLIMEKNPGKTEKIGEADSQVVKKIIAQALRDAAKNVLNEEY